MNRLNLILSLIVITLFGETAHAETDAKNRLNDVASFYSAMDHLSVSYSLQSKRTSGGEEAQHLRQSGRITWQRPMQLRVTTDGHDTPTVVCDGERLFAYSAAADSYQVVAAPVNLRGILRHESAALMPAATMILPLVDGDAIERLIEDAADITFRMTETIDGIDCDVIHVDLADQSMILWVAKGKQPWVQRVEKQVRIEGEGFVYKLPRQIVRYTDWKVSAKPKQTEFAIPTPTESKRVDVLMARTRPIPEVHPLLGVEVSDTPIEMIDSSFQTIADFEDRQVLVLAFWATWSSPSIEALTALESLADDADKTSVAFRVINAGESFGDVQKFLRKQNVKLPLALDEDGVMADRFVATSIPMVVIVDRNSVVQAVHVGFDETTSDKWRRDIAAVIAGRELAIETWEQTQDESSLTVVFPTGSAAKTLIDMRPDRYAFHRRTLIDPYREVGKRDAKWDDSAEAFLDEMAKHFSRLKGYKKVDELLILGDAVIKLGCDDPLVRYCHALMQFRSTDNAGEQKKSIQMIEQVLPELVIRRYPANRCYPPASHLREFYTQTEKRPDKAKKYLDACWKNSLAMLMQDDITDDGTLVIADEVMSFFKSLPKGLQGNYFFSAKKFEKESRWLVNVIGGEMHLDKAWQARGNETTIDDWDGFNDHLRRARNCFGRAHKACPGRPHAAAGMITVAMGSSENAEAEMQMWFNRAVHAQLDHNAAYHRLFNGLRPRWHGSIGQVLEFGRLCASTKRYDTDLPYMLYEAAWKIMRDHHNPLGNRFVQRAGLYEELVDVTEAYIADRKTRGDDLDWWRSIWLGFAYRVENWQDARQLIEQMDGKLNNDALDRFPLQPDKVVADVMTKTSPNQDEIHHVDLAIEAGDYADAVAEVDALLLDETLHPSVAKRLRSKRVACDWRVRLASGQEASLLPVSKDFEGWQILGGEFIKRHTGAIRIESRADGMAAVSEIDFGPRWKLSCDIVHGASPYARWNAGFSFYESDKRLFVTVFNPKREFVAATTLEDLYEDNTPFKPKSDTVRFEVQMNDGLVDVWCDGKHLIERKPLPDFSPEKQYHVAIGGHYRYADAVLTYRNLTLQPLGNQP